MSNTTCRQILFDDLHVFDSFTQILVACFFMNAFVKWNLMFLTAFTNPPTNLTCKVKFSEAYYPWPLVEMRWDAPDFIAFGEVRGYIVFSDNGLHKDKVVTNVRTEIELNGIDDIETAEEVYGLFVKIDRLGRERQSAPARCDFTTVNRGMCMYVRLCKNVLTICCKVINSNMRGLSQEFILTECCLARVALIHNNDIHMCSIIGERERANLVVQLARFFYIYIYIYIYGRVLHIP